MGENEQLESNPVFLRKKALMALQEAKKLEQQQIKNGAKWKQYHKTAVLEKQAKK